MKTIFDKIEPKYLECTTGQCEHAIHAGNGILWVVVFALAFVLLKLHIRLRRK